MNAFIYNIMIHELTYPLFEKRHVEAVEKQ
jgi:hypothetical protein